jgi:hypothetical protein
MTTGSPVHIVAVLDISTVNAHAKVFKTPAVVPFQMHRPAVSALARAVGRELMTKITAYPLCWPSHIPRTAHRQNSKFKASLATALKNVEASLQRFAKDSGKKIDNIVISSNVTLGEERPKETGIAVWFSWDKMSLCIPVDRYHKVQDNLQAIHHVLEARRTEMRHSGIHLVRAAFTGFTALPSPEMSAALGWREAFGFKTDETPSMIEVKKRFRHQAKIHHPDKPSGNAHMFKAVNEAWQQAQEELGK